MKSPPFDIGFTTRAALGALKKEATYSSAKAASDEKNQQSQSNGSLMRITPLAVWTSSMSDEESILKTISLDVSMTHPHVLVHHAICLYCVTIHFLLKNKNDPDRGYNAFMYGLEKSKTEGYNASEKGESCTKWLEMAKELS